MTDDPERLLAEALRAQAARTPLSESATSPVAQFGLLSGSDLPLIAQPEPTTRLEPDTRPRVGWVLLIAVLLGLAAGSLVGLLTLI
ncbi:hypothetical protein [Actinokineospora xionganensis]|uniref:Uncharacterized protein n=1 Tax=Actinokineospora xionganensis TaxID=2684470 RepID=A0ABR7L2W9_9PSEU|nr:hypothetical protein [Actinokineospora xionganensis]MBC6446764.1 hypothetical protein [Actinokineospora xionganensis]